MNTTCPVNQSLTDFGCMPNDPGGFVSKFYGIGLGYIGALAVLGIIFGGYLLLASQGNPERVAKGRRYVYFSIAGLLLALFSYLFMQTIAVDILHLPGFVK